MYQNYYQPTNLIRVSGIEGARAYQMAPNSVQAMFHESENIMYVKSTDGAGFPTIRTFKFEEVIEKPQDTSIYVTKDDFMQAINELKEAISNGKRPIQRQDSKQ